MIQFFHLLTSISMYIYISQSLSLDIEELESDLSLEDSILKSQRFLENALIFLISWRKPDFLEMLKSILFCFLGDLSSLLHLFSDFMYCFIVSDLFPIDPLSPSLMVRLVRVKVHSSELCDI